MAVSVAADRTQFFYPNKLVRLILLAMEEVQASPTPHSDCCHCR